MPDHEDSLGGETFSGEEQQDPAEQSLGDGHTMGGDTAAHSLGDQSTFGDANVDDELLDDEMKLEDLSERYTEEGVLGKGGMGEVILATDTRLGRKVAIKRILGKAARSKTAVARFLTEAKSMAELNHTNIVQIHDYGRSTDGPFLIMECVQGGSLLEKCKAGPIELDEAVNIFSQLCDGLAKAHAAGIIHRDIKPANVLMSEDGIPKLTDFGLAKEDTTDTGMTTEGAVIGTLDFMPPEQRKGAELTDQRSDLWSLAATLYQMLTGKSPKVINISAIPPKLQSVVAKALEEAKEDRFQSAHEMRGEILDAHSGKMDTTRTLAEGECPQCAIPNPAHGKFCVECGAGLQIQCLKCEMKIQIWNKACGECGSLQDPLVEKALADLKNACDQAERLLVDFEFEAALEQSEVVASKTDSRLQQYAEWRDEFIERWEQMRQAEYSRLAERLKEAIAQERANDFGTELQSLRQNAPSARHTHVSGVTDTSDAKTERLTAKQSRLQELEGIIRKRITKKDITRLLPIVDEFLKLKPNRLEVQELKSQLEEREAQIDARIKLILEKAKAKESASIRNRKFFKRVIVTVFFVAIVITGVVIKNDIDAKAVESAISNLDWETVLELDPDNSEGLRLKAAAVADALDTRDWKAVLALDPNNSMGLRLKTAAEKAAAVTAALDTGDWKTALSLDAENSDGLRLQAEEERLKRLAEQRAEDRKDEQRRLAAAEKAEAEREKIASTPIAKIELGSRFIQEYDDTTSDLEYRIPVGHTDSWSYNFTDREGRNHSVTARLVVKGSGFFNASYPIWSLTVDRHTVTKTMKGYGHWPGEAALRIDPIIFLVKSSGRTSNGGGPAVRIKPALYRTDYGMPKQLKYPPKNFGGGNQ